MRLKCESHNDRDAVAVCHHCGRPLCELFDLSNNTYSLFSDNSDWSLDRLCGCLIETKEFYSEPGKPIPKSSHCINCLRTYHQREAALQSLLEEKLPFHSNKLLS